MLITIFLAIVFCAAISLMLLSAVAFIQNKKFFSSAPKEAQNILKPRNTELFYGARSNRLGIDGFQHCDDHRGRCYIDMGRLQMQFHLQTVFSAVCTDIYDIQDL